jgi:hypothetical protein
MQVIGPRQVPGKLRSPIHKRSSPMAESMARMVRLAAVALSLA